MRHSVSITIELDTYTAAGAERAPAVLIAALRALHQQFSREGIFDTGKAESPDGVRLSWSASQQETQQ